MDEHDGMLLALAVAMLGVAVLLLARSVRSLETDMELARLTAPATERND